MWILNFVPDWFFYLLLLIGILGFLVTYLLKFIPIPAIFVYRVPIQIVSVLLMVIGVYMAGSIANEESWQSKVKELENKLVEAEAQANKEVVKVVEKVVVQTQVIRQQGRDIVRVVDREIVKYDNKCEIPPEFIKIINDAASKPK